MRLVEPVLIAGATETTDEFGTPKPGPAGPTETTGYLDEQPGTEQLGDDGDRVQWDALLFLRPGTELAGDETITVRGYDWQIVGPPVRPRRPGARREHHVEVRLARTHQTEQEAAP